MIEPEPSINHQPSTLNPPAARVLIVGWDGLRPDLVSPAVMPNLCALIDQGVRFVGATAVFPSETRPNNAAIGTGCQPGRHGITANELFVPEVDDRAPITSGNHHHLAGIERVHGRILPVPTLGETLVSAGRRLLVIGSGSPGQTLLQNPIADIGCTINPAFCRPAHLEATLRKRFGAMPTAFGGAARAPVDDYLEQIVLDSLLAELEPDLLVLWSCEPDVSLHYYGLGAPEVEAALRANDARLGRVLERLDRTGLLEGTAVVFLSDHGHSTVRERIDLSRALAAVSPDLHVVGDGVRFGPGMADALPHVVGWLRNQPWCGPIFVRDDVWGDGLAGAAPASVLWDGAPGRWVPDVQFSCAWDDQPNERGVPGRSYAIGRPAARPLTMHGSLSPRDMSTMLVLAGAGMRRGVAVEAPAGPVDIAPTVLHLLGVDAPSTMQGRPLREALDGGGDPPPVTTEPLLEGAWGTLTRLRVDGSAYLRVV